MPATATRSRLESQGYVGVGEQTLRDIQSGLRFAPGLCGAGIALGTALASPWLLSVMMLTALAGAATPRHPFDVFYNHAVRHLIGKPPIPRNGAPRRFSCAVGTVWLAGTVAAFLLGWQLVGYVLGFSMAGMALFVAATHICLPSLIYTRLFEHVGDVPEVSPADAFNRLREGAIVVDVRDGELFHAGHIEGALHAPDGLASAARLDADSALLVICQSGVMSLKAAKDLREHGYLGACSVRGGMTSWLNARLPLAAPEARSS